MTRRLLFILFLCVFVRPLAAGEESATLHVYTWEGYFDSNVINDFQKKHNCTVALDVYDSNDFIHGAIVSGQGSYDIITPAPAVSAALHREGLLLYLDHSLLPNLRHLAQSAYDHSQDPGFIYSVPYTQTVTGIGYLKSRLDPSEMNGWGLFSKPELVKRTMLLNDMREVLGAALKRLGYSLNTVDRHEIEDAGRVIRNWLRTVKGLGLQENRAGLAKGDYLAVQCYDGEISLAMQENPDIGFFVPEEGGALNADDFVIPVDTPVPDLAHAFINHMLDPENAAANMRSVRYYMPNAAALAIVEDDEDFRRHPAFTIPPETMAKCEMIRDLGNDIRKYEVVWKAALAAEKIVE